MNHGTRQRVHQRLTLLDGAGLDLGMVLDETTSLLARAIPHDSSCWHTMDPATLVETSYRVYGMSAPSAQVAELAYHTNDYNSFVELATSPQHSGVLSEATEGHLERSLRYRELLSTVNVRGELRAAFVADGSCWGCFSMFREAPHDFTADERDFAHTLATLLGRLVRAAAIRASVTSDSPVPWPGVVLLDSARRVVSATDAAEAWLADVGFDGELGVDPLPFPVLTVAERVREIGEAASVRVLGRSGRWAQLHASPASGEPDRVAIVVQSAAPDSVAPLLSDAYGFTGRERELVDLIRQGLKTGEIADRLCISPHTVQTHLKSIFAKAGVRSRAELVGKRLRA